MITTVSTGVLSYSSSVTSVATVNSSGQVTPLGAGTTTITVSQAATANHPAASASATLTVSLPPPPISLASNNVTIQYTGAAGDVPNNMPRFIEANLRGTGNEWFAVVNDSSKTQITSYAKNEQSGISYFTTSGKVVPFNNIVTTLMKDMSSMFSNAYQFNQYIDSWDVSNVTNMSQMFYYATAFNNRGNSSIGSWNTGAVTDMSAMFETAREFNQDIGQWNTSEVKNMNRMFFDAFKFNQNISNWEVSQVTSFNLFRLLSALTNNNTPTRFR